MKLFNPYVGKPVEIEVTGDRRMVGLLIEVGPDHMVVYKEAKYIYLPFRHVHHLRGAPVTDDQAVLAAPEQPVETNGSHTFAHLLRLSMAGLVELYLGDNLPLFGKIIDTKDDYILLDTVRHRHTYIPIFHIKWFSPCPAFPFPDDESREAPVLPSPALKWHDLLNFLAGRVVVLNLGAREEQIGLLQTFDSGVAEMVSPDSTTRCWNTDHIKSVHFP
jgi:hypothetical protein